MNRTELLQLKVIVFLIWVCIFSLIAGLEIGRYIFSGSFNTDAILMDCVVFIPSFLCCLPFFLGVSDGILVPKRVVKNKLN